MTATLVTYAALTVPTNRIRRFERQPREYFDPAEIAARAESMRVVGQQTPIIVEAVQGDPLHDYELIDGESRWRSAQLAGIERMLVLVRSVAFATLIEKHLASLVANFNRSEHTPMEISNALALQARSGMIQAELATAIGKDQMWVSNYLSLQKLHPAAQALLDPRLTERERLPVTAAVKLAAAPLDKQMEAIAAARRTDGRITLARIKEVLEGVEGVRRRKPSPSKHRSMVEGALRAIGVAAAKVACVSPIEAAEIFKRLKANGEIVGVESVEDLLAVLSDGTAHNVSAREGFPDLPCLYDGTENPDGMAQLETLHDYWEARIDWTRPMPRTYLEIAYPRATAHRNAMMDPRKRKRT